MVDQNHFVEVANQLKQAKTILILLPTTPSIDHVAAALGLFLSLKKAQKQVQVGCTTPMSVAFSRLFGIDKIKTQVGCRSLVISFPYVEAAIEKVSYHVEGQKFNLVVMPKKGNLPLDPAQVSYTHAGAEADVVVVIGAQKWEDLGALYIQEKDSLINTPTIVGLDNRPATTQFSTHNLSDPQASSAAELAARLLRVGGFFAKGDMATNLLAGIEFATNNLQFKTTADTFEMVAWLLRRGGKRGHLAATPGINSLPQQFAPPTAAHPPMGYSGATPFSIPQPTTPLPTQLANPMMQPGQIPAANAANPPLSPFPPTTGVMGQMPVIPTTLPTASVNNAPPIVRETEATDKAQEGIKPQPSPDWYQPKIYRGKTLE